MEPNENGRKSLLGLLQAQKVILYAISTVSEGLLSKHQKPIPSGLCEGEGDTNTQFEDHKG